jgi:hypothetical protein
MGNASDMTANRFQLSEEPAFADILHPLSEDAFFAEYYDRKPLHLEGDPRKFAAVMSWDGLCCNRMPGRSCVCCSAARPWSQTTSTR